MIYLLNADVCSSGLLFKDFNLSCLKHSKIYLCYLFDTPELRWNKMFENNINDNPAR